MKYKVENNKIMNQIEFQLICIQIAILKNVDGSRVRVGVEKTIYLSILEAVN